MFNPVDWGSVFLPDASSGDYRSRIDNVFGTFHHASDCVETPEAGTLGMTDLLLITLLADASQNAMAGEYKSLPDGVVLVATIIFWNYLFDWLTVKSEWFERLIEPPPLPLLKRGKLLRRNMRSELITEAELLWKTSRARSGRSLKGKLVNIESDGQISVIQYEEKPHKPPERRGK